MRWHIKLPLVFAFLGCALPASAQSLGFEPQRVLIPDRKGTAVLTLRNTGKTPQGYRVEMVDVVYGNDGSVKLAQSSPAGFPSAKSFLRFSPSQVRLAPGESQKVRVLLRGSGKSLQAGEYRVHARMVQLPNIAGTKLPKASAQTVAGVVGVAQAIAIPIIVRRGQTTARGNINSIRVKSGKTPTLDLQLGRTGNASLYTNLILRDKGGKVASQIKGVALPVPNTYRRFFFPLGNLSPAQVRGYTLELVDHDSGKTLDKKTIR